MKPKAICEDDARREAVRAKPELNGLDYVEVGDDEATLIVYFLGKAPTELDKRQGESAEGYIRRVKRYWRIEGGSRIRNIQVESVSVTRNDDPELDDFVRLRVDQVGDFSTYTLQLVGIDNIDLFYDHVEFSFRVDCPSPFDCAQPRSCPTTLPPEPEINYLAKDYATFRQLILDRLALIMPDWRKRHVPDLGITLVEVLAYAADYLSYYQDAVATESYLDTARQRISVRRHCRLVDYTLREACAARAWLHITTDTAVPLNLRDAYFITSVRDLTGIDRTVLSMDDLRNLPSHACEVFEAARDESIQLKPAHNEIHFYSWGQRECCLPRGATAATLRDDGETKLNLSAGAVLIFEEVLGPRTGNPADADSAHRHPVRLTRVTLGTDPLNQVPVVEIEWGSEDALPFAVCISSITSADGEPPCAYLENVSVARGNVILVDNGLTIEPCEKLGAVRPVGKKTECDCIGEPGEVVYTAERFRPRLAQSPLAFRQPLPDDDFDRDRIVSAARLLVQDPRKALPEIKLQSIFNSPEDDGVVRWEEVERHTGFADALLKSGFSPRCYEEGLPLAKPSLDDLKNAEAARKQTQEALKKDPKNQKLKKDLANADQLYQELLEVAVSELAERSARLTPQLDLLKSGADDRDFVVEIDNAGIAHLRFGDDECGEQPKAGTSFYASYRVGGGKRGNVGAEVISQLVTRHETISGANITVRNPLAARGGADAEPIAEAKLFAPTQFRQELERAVIADDYARLAEREAANTQRAAAQLAWSGSWYEAEVAIDSVGNVRNPAELSEIQNMLERYRRIGHDLRTEWAEFVAVDLALDVCVLPDYLRGHVRAELADLFSNRVLPDGSRGFFHPDNLTFGEGVYLSKIVALAQTVAGVESVHVTRLNPLFEAPNYELKNGFLSLGPLQVAQLDNDPSFPERGKLTFEMRGGR